MIGKEMTEEGWENYLIEAKLKHYGRQGVYIKPYEIYEVPKGYQSTVIIPNEAPGGSTPSQYALPEGAKDIMDLIEYRDMDFSLGNIMKACYRIGHCTHSEKLRDLNKIKWFVERAIAVEEKKRRL